MVLLCGGVLRTWLCLEELVLRIFGEIRLLYSLYIYGLWLVRCERVLRGWWWQNKTKTLCVSYFFSHLLSFLFELLMSIIFQIIFQIQTYNLFKREWNQLIDHGLIDNHVNVVPWCNDIYACRLCTYVQLISLRYFSFYFRTCLESVMLVFDKGCNFCS